MWNRWLKVLCTSWMKMVMSFNNICMKHKMRLGSQSISKIIFHGFPAWKVQNLPFLAIWHPPLLLPSILKILSEYGHFIKVHLHCKEWPIRLPTVLFEGISCFLAEKVQKWPFLADRRPPTVHPLPLNIISDYVCFISINLHDMARGIRR